MAYMELESETEALGVGGTTWPSETPLFSALLAMIEHVDYGLLLLSVETREILVANARARHALQAQRRSGLALTDGRLHAWCADDENALERALGLAGKGVRSLLPFADTQEHSVGLIPAGGPGTHSLAMLIFSRSAACDNTSMALYAKACRLTAAESNVLSAICTGKRPHEVATECGVLVSTVRSQLRSIRQKSKTRSIRHLVETVSRLPPIARGMA